MKLFTTLNLLTPGVLIESNINTYSNAYHEANDIGEDLHIPNISHDWQCPIKQSADFIGSIRAVQGRSRDIGQVLCSIDETIAVTIIVWFPAIRTIWKIQIIDDIVKQYTL